MNGVLWLVLIASSLAGLVIIGFIATALYVISILTDKE